MKTTNRKFFYGDRVFVTDRGSNHLTLHSEHSGHVISTQIRRWKTGDKRGQDTVYRVACDCGRTLSPNASYLQLVKESGLDLSWRSTSLISSRISRNRAHFLLTETLGLKGYSVNHRPLGVLKKLLAELAPMNKDIIIRRFGLMGFPGESMQEIADNYGFTRQAVDGREKRALKEMVRIATSTKDPTEVSLGSRYPDWSSLPSAVVSFDLPNVPVSTLPTKNWLEEETGWLELDSKPEVQHDVFKRVHDTHDN